MTDTEFMLAVLACEAQMVLVLKGEEGVCARCNAELDAGTPIVFLRNGSAAEAGLADYHVACFETYATEILNARTSR